MYVISENQSPNPDHSINFKLNFFSITFVLKMRFKTLYFFLKKIALVSSKTKDCVQLR